MDPIIRKEVANICYFQKSETLSCFFVLLLSLLLALLPVAFIAGPVKAEVILTNEQYQILISNLKEVRENLQQQGQIIQKLKQNSTEEQNQIKLLSQQLEESQKSMEQAAKDLAKQTNITAEAQNSLTSALEYSKRLEKEIKWLKVRGWLLFGLGILTGHFL